MNKLKLVSAALLVNDGGEVLISKRMDDQAQGGFWEFPGGKMEPGESPTETLAREIREELGCEIAIGRVYDVMFHRYPTFDVLMIVYTCAVRGAAQPTCVAVADLAWVPAGDLGRYPILPADEPIVRRLITEGAPKSSI